MPWLPKRLRRVVDQAAEKDADVDSAVKTLLDISDQLRDTAKQIERYAARKRGNTGDQPSAG
jgi:ABC-type transporter Mla subunit MlaD